MERGESMLFMGGVFTVAAPGTDELDFGPNALIVLPLSSSPSGILLTLAGFRFGFLRSVL